MSALPDRAAVLAALHRLADAFNRHDADAVVRQFAPEGEMHLPHGDLPDGEVSRGREAVRSAVAARFRGLPDVRWLEATHHVCGALGVSTWTVAATGRDGRRHTVRGVDLYHFDAQARVLRKDSYWKGDVPPVVFQAVCDEELR